MERAKNKRSIRKQRKKAPGIPIKTYKWEDIRRARLRGGYPWTYLYKQPYDEPLDPKPFTIMESLPKSKSASTIGKPSEYLEIQEVSDGASQGSLTPEPSGYIIITDVPSDSDNHSNANQPLTGSITIQEQGVDEPEILNLELDEPEILNLESAESSDNISQYLDKDEPLPAEVLQGPSVVQQERAKSEEPKRKRKLSVDSSYSRKSLSKLAIIKKLKEAKEKIKVPKFLPAILRGDDKPVKKEPEKAVVEVKTKTKRFNPNEKPVYIHIPLKPPEGETDEFSYLEFGEKKPEEKPVTPEPVRAETATTEEDEKKEEELDQLQPPAELQRKFSGPPDEIVAIEILKAESFDLDDPSPGGKSNNFYKLQQGPESAGEDDVVAIILPEEPGPSKLSRQPSKPLSRQPSKKRAKSAEPPERKRKLSIDSSYSRKSLSKLGQIKKTLKDAKERFKLSRLSLPKLSSSSKKQKKSDEVKEEAPKKATEAPRRYTGPPQYIHIPLKPPPGETDEFSYLEFESKPVEKEQPVPKVEQQESVDGPESVDSPESVPDKDVQFIFLTPPSDDEILDGPDVPETPLSVEDKSFFKGKIEELKVIAKDAIEEASPESKRKMLAIVSEDTAKPEEASSEAASSAPKEEAKEKVKLEVAEPKEKKKIEKEKMVIDEEDGLKLTESAMAKQEQNVKAKEAEAEEKPLKKKVSFKRRSRDEGKDGIYEDIQAPAGEDAVKNITDDQKTKLAVLGTSQSMSVDEEKSYLDEKIIKSTSLEEDYNRWSKLSDHEYEPVNPPPDNVSPIPPPAVHVVDADRQKPISTASSTTSLERRMLGADLETEKDSYTAHEMQAQIEDKFFKPALKPALARTSPSPAKILKETPEKAPAPPKESKLQAFKAQTAKFKTKLHGIKKPNFTLPPRPKIKFDKSKFKMPEAPKFKMPEAPKISLPTFSLPRKKPQQRQYSTESNAGDSKTSHFDFKTFPRIFKRKSSRTEDDFPKTEEFATVPRVTRRTKDENKTKKDRWGGRDSIRIPLHAEEEPDEQQSSLEQREDSVERRMEEASRIRYDDEIDDIDDAYEKENQAIHTASPFSNGYRNTRWNHGSFHPEPSRQEMELNLRNREVTDLDSPQEPPPNDSFDTNTSKDVHSSESSLGIHRRGVLEEIDSDEFFLRQKGISQDNIEIGTYLSSEIREAFKSPTNALSDLQRDVHESNQSLPETPSKRKVIKKPKRKKTPHVSHEQISIEDSEDTELFPPSRPKRRSKRRKKPEAESVVPYQETIVQSNEAQMYENEQMDGIEQPEIKVIDPYEEFESDEEFRPEAPPRRHRSLKSLTYSDHDSIMGDFNRELSADVDIIYTKEHEYIIPTPEVPPIKPPRTLSRSSSQQSKSEEPPEFREPPVRPQRTRSRSRTRSQPDLEEPCIEEPCIQQVCDYMGYATVDKQKREPPLPPPRTPPRRKKIQSRVEQRFFTVPRPLNDTAPVRPLRSYSTLGPSRPPRRKPVPNMTDEEKENIDITQYIEIEEEAETNRDLQSGEVIQKMRDRPLPAPPRPPRKTSSKPPSDESDEKIPEETVSTQTEPLPDDFVCEDVKQEDSDTVLTPRRSEETKSTSVVIERRLITPTQYSFEETVTHGTLVVEPLNGAKILPDHELTRERVIPVEKEDDYDETSEIPEEFHKLKDPKVERPSSRLSGGEVEVLRAQKLQVSDLDVDRLSVNELMANKIVVSEIDSGNILVSEISSKSGALKIGELELPPGVVQQLFERLQEASRGASPSEEPKSSQGQKKNAD